jgi:hypothetical protein
MSSSSWWRQSKALLLRLHKEYKLAGAVRYSGNEAETSKYSHRETAKIFAIVAGFSVPESMALTLQNQTVV